MILSRKLLARSRELKQDVPNCLLLMQVGAFMQVIDQDARTVSQVTGRKLQMAGQVDDPVEESILIPAGIEHGPPFAEEAGRSKILSHVMWRSITFHTHNGEPGTQRAFSVGVSAPKLLQSAARDDML
jgi:hypothetical protein